MSVKSDVPARPDPRPAYTHSLPAGGDNALRPAVIIIVLIMVINVFITQVAYNLFALPIVGKFVKLSSVLVFVGVLVRFVPGSSVPTFLSAPILSTARVAGGHILSKILKHEPFPDSPQPGFFSQLLLSRPLRRKYEKRLRHAA